MQLVSIIDMRKVVHMARKKFSTLTEPMFYLLMSLVSGKKCGIDISAYILKKSGGRVPMGPGTLYALLADFENEKVISYVGMEGKRKIYAITDYGRELYREELERLKQCVFDAESEDEIVHDDTDRAN